MERINITDTKAWSSIDIFLFSNGQQYSPPRKYHLTSEELQWWGATLSYLGRTQYGSGHSTIELYTITGVKVYGPLDLINGAAYVAVKLPDSFINTGYEDYLLKASRSWEKRLTQKANDNEITKHENNDLKTKTFADEILANTVENLMDEADLSKIRRDSTITSATKTQPNRTQHVPQRKFIAKQIQKKKSFDTQNATDKVFSGPRKSSLKKSDDANLCKRNINQLQAVRPKKTNFGKRAKGQGAEYNNIQPEIGTTQSAKPQLPCNKELNLQIVNGTDKSWNVSKTLSKEEQEVISLYKNKDIDLTSLLTDPDYDRVIEEQNDALINSISTQKVYVQEYTDNHKDVNGIKQTSKIHDLEQNYSPPIDFKKYEEEKAKSSSISAIKTTAKEKLNIEPNNITNNQITDEYIAYMNKGALLLLKFHIKVKDCKTICNRHKSDLEQTASLINMLKSDKTSQVNVDVNFSCELLSPNKEYRKENKSLQPIINKFYTETNNKSGNENPRILMLQCTCKKYSNNEKLCRCPDEEEKSNSTQNEELNRTLTCCKCYDELYRVLKEDNVQHNDMDMSSEKEYKLSLSKNNGTRVKALTQKFEGSDKILTDHTNDNHLMNNNGISRDENNLQALVVTRLSETLTEQDNNQVKDENSDATLKYNCDKATQADWSNVLLEARRQKDDTYTFHLPSLYVLKQCKL